jgi:RNA polymerase sigma-70 factor (ECF subfamily)
MKEERAFEELLKKWERRLYYYLKRILQDETAVWDVLQEIWLSVFRSIKKLKDPRKFSCWLYQISHNKAMDWLRNERRESGDREEISCNGCTNDFLDYKFRSEDAERIHKLLNELSITHREILTLHFVQYFSYKEIAKIVGVPEGTVKSRLHYAKRKLIENLKEHNNVRTR